MGRWRMSTARWSVAVAVVSLIAGLYDPGLGQAVLNTGYNAALGSACSLLQTGDVDEVWLWGGPWFGYLEHLLIQPKTFCPGVEKRFTVMGFSYERGVGEQLHDLGHLVEEAVQ